MHPQVGLLPVLPGGNNVAFGQEGGDEVSSDETAGACHKNFHEGIAIRVK